MSYADDFMINNKWQEFFYGGGAKIATKAFVLHKSIKHRVLTPTKKDVDHYFGCDVSDEFQDFQFFTQWCSNQIGYGNVDSSGRSWPIDKDLILKGNKTYGKDVCSFIPTALNALITKRVNKKSGLPPGVNANGNLYSSMCIDENGKSKFLGNFKCKEKAFEAYKEFKESVIKKRAIQYKNQIDERVFNSLMNWSIEAHDFIR